MSITQEEWRNADMYRQAGITAKGSAKYDNWFSKQVNELADIIHNGIFNNKSPTDIAREILYKGYIKEDEDILEMLKKVREEIEEALNETE